MKRDAWPGPPACTCQDSTWQPSSTAAPSQHQCREPGGRCSPQPLRAGQRGRSQRRMHHCAAGPAPCQSASAAPAHVGAWRVSVVSNWQGSATTPPCARLEPSISPALRRMRGEHKLPAVLAHAQVHDGALGDRRVVHELHCLLPRAGHWPINASTAGRCKAVHASAGASANTKPERHSVPFAVSCDWHGKMDVQLPTMLAGCCRGRRLICWHLALRGCHSRLQIERAHQEWRRQAAVVHVAELHCLVVGVPPVGVHWGEIKPRDGANVRVDQHSKHLQSTGGRALHLARQLHPGARAMGAHEPHSRARTEG